MDKRLFQERFFRGVRDLAVFRFLLDMLPDVAFFVKDIKGRIVTVNRRNCEIYNCENELELIGKTDEELVSGERARLYAEEERRIMESGEPVINAISVGPEASHRMVIYSKIPLYGRKGQVVGIAGVHRFVEGAKEVPLWQRRFATVVSYIHDHYTEPLTLQTLAKQAGFSSSQLERRFQKILGTTPIAYLLKVRVEAARMLLENTNRTIADIAVSTGFYDNSHLTRHFKRIRGCSPKAYLMRHRRGAAPADELPKL